MNMSTTSGFGRFFRGMALAGSALVCVTGAIAAEHSRTADSKETAKLASGETVEMFAAMKSGNIVVQLIPKDSTESRVIITNKTDKPLNVKLPAAFAGVPVLTQVGGANGGMGAMGAGGRNNRNGNGNGIGVGNNNNNNNQQNQGVGGGMLGNGNGNGNGNAMGNGNGNGRQGAGFFNVPADRTAQFKVATVCLDHGLADPRPRISYEIRPIESYSEKVGVAELCELLGKGSVDQRVAQAAAWNLNNGMSWDDLANKKVHRLGGPTQPYFTKAELKRAKAIAKEALELAKTKPAAPAPSLANTESMASK